MKMINSEIEKIREIFSILEFSENEANDQIEKLGEVVMAKVVAEALAKKEFIAKGDILKQEDAINFLQANYTDNEISELINKVAKNIVSEYFSKIMENVPKEKVSLIKNIF